MGERIMGQGLVVAAALVGLALAMPAAQADEGAPASGAAAASGSAKDEAATVAPPPYAELRKLFDELEAAHRDGDEGRFRANVHGAAWKKNLVGGSGTPVRGLFKQGVRKKWILRPDLDRVVRVGPNTLMVSVEIFAWEKARRIQGAGLVVVREGDRWVVLGGGKKRVQVAALAQRHARGEDLAPPAPPAPPKALEPATP